MYVGIWYKTISIPTVVWVANREVPTINNTAGSLEIIKPRILVIRNETDSIIWSSSSSSLAVLQNPVAKFLDSRNLVVKAASVDDDPENFLWQTFDYPTHTLLPGMKFGRNLVTGHEIYISSWKSFEDPAVGNFTRHCDPTGYPQNVERIGGMLIYRSGLWNGEEFNLSFTPNPIFSYEVVYNSEEIFYRYKLLESTLSRFTLSPSGVAQRLIWDNRSESWKAYQLIPRDSCDSYALCGPNGICDFLPCVDVWKILSPRILRIGVREIGEMVASGAFH